MNDLNDLIFFLRMHLNRADEKKRADFILAHAYT